MKDEVSKREGQRTMENNDEVNRNKSSSNDTDWKAMEE